MLRERERESYRPLSPSLYETLSGTHYETLRRSQHCTFVVINARRDVVVCALAK